MADFQGAVDEVYTALGVDATYTDRNGAGSCVLAIIEHDLQQFGNVADVAGKTAVISVRVSEVEGKPRRGESFTISGTVYTVDSVILSDELEHRALVA